MIIHIRNALSTKPEDRVHAYDMMIVSMMLHTPGLKDALQYCSEIDKLRLSKACSSFVVSEGSEHVIATAGSVIDECYIVIKGVVDLYQNPALTAAELEASVQPNGVNVLEGCIAQDGVGKILGLDILNNRHTWSYDCVAQNGTCICVIPVSALKLHVGFGGFRAQDVMECFWKYYKLWEYIYDEDKKAMRLVDALFGAATTFNHDFDKVDKTPRLPIDVTSCARIKCFSPGQEIFTQGMPRDYLYILIMGEGSFVRRFPDWTEDIPLEVKIGLTLYPGDFSFMDGEDKDWAVRNRAAHLEQGHLQEEIDETQGYESQRNDAYRLLFAAKIRNRELVRNRYGVHKNTLIATTRAEVCVIPLSAIGDCQNAFKGLLRVTAGKYRLTLYSDEDLIRRYHENRIWGLQKTKIISKTLGLGTKLQDQKETSSQNNLPRTKESSMRASSPRSSSKPFSGTIDDNASFDSTAEAPAVDISEINVEIEDAVPQSQQMPPRQVKAIQLVNPRQYSRPGSKAASKPSSPGNSSRPTSVEKRVSSLHRAALQGALANSCDQSSNKSHGQKAGGAMIYKGGSLSDRIKSFYKATANSKSDPLQTELSPNQPSVPTIPTVGKRSNQSIRAKKVTASVKNNLNFKERSQEPAGKHIQLSFIQEGLNENSLAESSTMSSCGGDARLDSSYNNPLLGGRKKHRTPGKHNRGASDVRVDNSELSLQAFAEKNAEMYVMKFRKKKAEMKVLMGTPEQFSVTGSVASTVPDKKNGIISPGGVSFEIKSDSDKNRASTMLETSQVTTTGSSRRNKKQDIDELISTLITATARTASR